LVLEIVFSGGELALAELEERNGLIEVLQPVFAELAQAGEGDERRRRRRNEHLPAMAASGDAGGTVDVGADVTLLGQVRRAGVDAHNEEGIALSVDLDPAVADERGSHDSPVFRKCPRIPFRPKRVQQLGRALNVREEERDCARGKVRAHGRMIHEQQIDVTVRRDAAAW
jgi:hypothetical protein